MQTFIADYCLLVPPEQESKVCQVGIVERSFF